MNGSPVPPPGSCVVCQSDQVHEVNRLIVVDVPVREIERRTGLSRSAIGRHKLRHLAEAYEEGGLEPVDVVVGELVHSSDVHARLSALAMRLERVLEFSAKIPQRATQTANVARELRQCLEAIAKLQTDDAERSLADRHAGQLVEMLSWLLEALGFDPQDPRVIEVVGWALRSAEAGLRLEPIPAVPAPAAH